MFIQIQGVKCSMGCAHAEGPIMTCECSCKGKTHGYFAQKPPEVAVRCSPSVEKRCKEGNESGRCKCGCGGINHGLYQIIPNFEAIRITVYGEEERSIEAAPLYARA